MLPFIFSFFVILHFPFPCAHNENKTEMLAMWYRAAFLNLLLTTTHIFLSFNM